MKKLLFNEYCAAVCFSDRSSVFDSVRNVIKHTASYVRLIIQRQLDTSRKKDLHMANFT